MAEVAGIARRLSIRVGHYCLGAPAWPGSHEKAHTLPAMPAGDAEIEVSFAEIFRQWGRIGCIGFGGPPAHIALFRELCVRAARVADRCAVRAGGRRHQPAARPRLHPARDLLAPGGCAVRGARCWVGSASSCPASIAMLALSALFLSGSPPTWLRGAGMGAGAAVAAVAVRAGLGVCGADLASCRGRPSARRDPLRARRGPRGGLWRRVAGARAARLRCDRAGQTPARASPGGPARLRDGRAVGSRPRRKRAVGTRAVLAAVAHERRRTGRHGCPRLDGPEGRRAGLRRWFRDRSADGSGRGQHLPLDDPRPVPQRRGARTGHPRAAHPDRSRRRLLGGRASRWAAGRGGGLRAILLLHPVRRRPLRAPARQRARARVPRRRRPAAAGRSWERPCRCRRRSRRAGSTRSSPAAAVALLVLRRSVVPTLLLAGCAGIAAALLGAPTPR